MHHEHGYGDLRQVFGGRKEFIALADGYREPAESWADLLRDCARRGMRAPAFGPSADRGGGPGDLLSWNRLVLVAERARALPPARERP